MNRQLGILSRHVSQFNRNIISSSKRYAIVNTFSIGHKALFEGITTQSCRRKTTNSGYTGFANQIEPLIIFKAESKTGFLRFYSMLCLFNSALFGTLGYYLITMNENETPNERLNKDISNKILLPLINIVIKNCNSLEQSVPQWILDKKNEIENPPVVKTFGNKTDFFSKWLKSSAKEGESPNSTDTDEPNNEVPAKVADQPKWVKILGGSICLLMCGLVLFGGCILPTRMVRKITLLPQNSEKAVKANRKFTEISGQRPRLAGGFGAAEVQTYGPYALQLNKTNVFPLGSIQAANSALGPNSMIQFRVTNFKYLPIPYIAEKNNAEFPNVEAFDFVFTSGY